MSLSIDSRCRRLHELSRASMQIVSNAIKYRRATKYRRAETSAEKPQIPDNLLFEPLSIDVEKPCTTPQLPIPAQCATHLELLQVFFVLHQRVLKSEELDKLFGTEAVHPVVRLRDQSTKTLRDRTFSNRRELKWTKFLEYSVTRFLAWWRKGREIFKEGQDESCILPPVDVLMVWHAFLLNPRFFRAHCQSLAIYKVGFPWRQIHEAIDNHDWTFALPKSSSDHFENVTGLSSNLFEQLSNWKSWSSTTKTDLVALSIENPPDSPSTIINQEKDDRIRCHFEVFRVMNNTLAVQLRDAVIRQSSFVEKMNGYLWIRSPAVEGTINRAIERYRRFLKLLKLYPTAMLVPTLDIDLVWHTHQCSPSTYFDGTNEFAGKFVNHDDSIVQKILNTGFDTTQSLYRIRFAEEYPICGCWDCEALLSELEDPIRTEDGSPDIQAIAGKVISDIEYYRSVELSRIAKEALPVRS